MTRRDHIDAFGAAALTGFAILLAFNQVVIKVTNGGLQPVFFAGLRSLGAVFCVGLWLWWRGISLRAPRPVILWGLATGVVFSVEFLCLFVALDLTTVARSGILFYSMPVWMALGAALFIPGERITAQKGAGLALCMGGVAIAFLDRQGGQASVWGDLAAVGGAMGWAATALMAKASPLRAARPEAQLFWQVAVSGPLLLLLAPLLIPVFGPLVRDLQPIHLAALAFQIVVVVSAGFIFWLWLLARYPASGVASFSFLSPVFSVGLGWLLLDDPVGPSLLVALVLVAAGIVLINRRQVPQNVAVTR